MNNPSGDSSIGGGALQGDGVAGSTVYWPGTIDLNSASVIDGYTEGVSLDISNTVFGGGALTKTALGR